MKPYIIKPLPLVKIKLDMGAFTYRVNHGNAIWAPVYAWYVTDGNQRILVDTGVEDTFIKTFRGVQAAGIASLEHSLEDIGLKPGDIDLIIQTHLHYDHCGNTAKCKNARIIVQEEELEFAFSPHPIVANLYHKPFFEGLDFVKVQGRSEIVTGIEVIPVPGHSPGAQAVMVETEQGKAVISGFCCVKENFEPAMDVRKVFPVLAPGVHTNAMDAFDSVQRVKDLADIIIPQHDPCFLNVEKLP